MLFDSSIILETVTCYQQVDSYLLFLSYFIVVYRRKAMHQTRNCGMNKYSWSDSDCPSTWMFKLTMDGVLVGGMTNPRELSNHPHEGLNVKSNDVIPCIDYKIIPFLSLWKWIFHAVCFNLFYWSSESILLLNWTFK